jgi:tight adherence protein C
MAAWGNRIDTQWATVAALSGFLAPELWLKRRANRRQAVLARSLPDFLDLMVACLEAGQSVQAAVQRVTDELRLAHPVLSQEMSIVQREIELGATPASALKHCADRSGTDSIRSLGAFVEQTQRFGTTLVEALRVHADTLRTQREQRAEEKAQRAAVKILFPTLLFIFPAIFVVLAGPAAIQLHEHFSRSGGTFSSDSSR